MPPTEPAARAALDPDQQSAVEAPGGPLLVIAGPGSGKTRVLTHRVARLVAAGADPASIVLLTFTQKAAREMVERLATLLGPAARAIWAGTFHALCLRLLRTHADRIGLRRDFGLIDPGLAREVLDGVLAEVLDGAPPGLTAGLPASRTILRILSLSLNADRSLADAARRLAPDAPLDLLDGLCGAYAGRKLELNLLDFDDLLVFGELLLAEDPPLADAIARRCRHVLVDEYQDTNPVQARLVARLTAHHGDLCAVGDDAQAIYGFRGADVGLILDLAGRARTARLSRNHRSTAPIVALSNACLSHLRRGLPKALVSAVGDGPRPGLIRLDDTAAEARFIVDRALALAEDGVPLEDQAALYRAHAHARALQLELGRRGVPFAVRGGPRVFEQVHIRDVLAHLRVVGNPFDAPAWRRIFRLVPGIGAVGGQQIIEALFAGGDPWRALADDVISGLTGRAATGYRKTRATLLDLAQLAGRPGPMVARVLTGGYTAHLERAFPDDHRRRLDDLRALVEHAEGHDADGLLEALALAGRLEVEQPGLTLSTIHQAKGLEWTAVYVMGLAEGAFPARFDGDMDEERRLFYVALTRARRLLHLCCPASDGDGGLPRRISRFVAEITDRDPTLVERWPGDT